MSEFQPVTTVRDLATIDENECMAGYLAGLRGAPEPGNTATRSAWHGWRNGMVDGGHREKDWHQSVLAADVCLRMPLQ
ncbi:ribosome modulation factor [Microvirga lupini]|uniref:Ribosome modulation factor n=1 Tax=Microvirga lupini TaxID=420324 RepID=A0A7W4VI47_9HYPH|nr:hypothetical protein [Microvirga lupini]MBB3017639.1 ribosome modulation factor [Microvirga lupini]